MTQRLRLILGDQLAHDSPQLAALDPACDRLLLIEAPGEATHVWSHKARIALFLAAMRHYAAELRKRGLPLEYIELDDPAYGDCPSLTDRLARVLDRERPAELVVVEPGEWRLREAIRALAAARGLRLTELPDTHFLCSRADFAAWAGGKRELRMEFFYRWMRRRERVLVDAENEPAGGQWNFDADNRKPYPKTGPGAIPPPAQFAPDKLTREVLALVEARFHNHPGSLAHFAWPVTRAQALAALERFVAERLPHFGPYQDAMWTGTPFGWHALVSTSLNLKLLHPREVIDAAVAAWQAGAAPLASVEGFVRQVLGWREFIRGVYWQYMPQLAQANFYGHRRALPRWYWTGQTQMACMRECIGQTLEHGFAHHIQRLMVTGQFALLAGIEPRQVADWYLAVYVDAVEWVELPNVAGMALFADGGRFTGKPYVASGQYIKRQSNYCASCRYRPEQRSGERACPVTVLYWAFLDRHHDTLAANPRTILMAKSVARLPAAERAAICADAARMLDALDTL
ncbi:MAG: cryptochrome/photolyase family protein [Betaproteobacteria bacterium]|jgi:deoxyribodipyrimidine photolyase-related protein